LIDHGADVNRLSYLNYSWPLEGKAFISFEPAIITATRHNSPELCRLLLRNNVKINKADSFSMSALHWAASLNLMEILSILFEHNPNPSLLDLKNQTPIEKAILNGNDRVVKMFVERFSFADKYREYLLMAMNTSNTFK
jgi:ankyrin repeat protein